MLIYFESEQLCARLWVYVCITEAMEEAEGEGADEGRSNEEVGVKPSQAGGQGEGRGDAGWEKAKEVKKWDAGSWERTTSLARLPQTRRLMHQFTLPP